MFRCLLSVLLLVVFTIPGPVFAGPVLPGVPSTLVGLTPPYRPALLKGITLHPKDPLLLDFIIDPGQDRPSGAALKEQGERSIKYFLAALAIPPQEVWVNLSPYEKDRIIPKALSQTQMGRDMLAEDYLLKQLSASLIYPEKSLGKEFWEKLYAQERELYGTSLVTPINTFNKIWIMADRARVFQNGKDVFVVDSHLKVMLEGDYLAMRRHIRPRTAPTVAAQVLKEVVLPAIEKEVNTGRHFAPLRQMFNAIILAGWYRDNLQQAVLNRIYTDQQRTAGISIKDQSFKGGIYQQYLQAYKKGVFNLIKEDRDQMTGRSIPHKYFAGGIQEAVAAHPRQATPAEFSAAFSGQKLRELRRFRTRLVPQHASLDQAMNAEQLSQKNEHLRRLLNELLELDIEIEIAQREHKGQQVRQMQTEYQSKEIVVDAFLRHIQALITEPDLKGNEKRTLLAQLLGLPSQNSEFVHLWVLWTQVHWHLGETQGLKRMVLSFAAASIDPYWGVRQKVALRTSRGLEELPVGIVVEGLNILLDRVRQAQTPQPFYFEASGLYERFFNLLANTPHAPFYIKVRRGRGWTIRIRVQGHSGQGNWEAVYKGLIGFKLSVLRYNALINKALNKLGHHAQGDQAMPAQTPGGIDLNASTVHWEVHNKAAVHIQMDPAMLEKIGSKGLVGLLPEILSIAPFHPSN